jgi:hypothetical protein
MADYKAVIITLQNLVKCKVFKNNPTRHFCKFTLAIYLQLPALPNNRFNSMAIANY